MSLPELAVALMAFLIVGDAIATRHPEGTERWVRRIFDR